MSQKIFERVDFKNLPFSDKELYFLCTEEGSVICFSLRNSKINKLFDPGKDGNWGYVLDGRVAQMSSPPFFIAKCRFNKPFCLAGAF